MNYKVKASMLPLLISLPILIFLIYLCLIAVLLVQDVSDKRRNEDSSKYNNIDINILSVTATKEKQTFIERREFRDGKLIWSTKSLEPDKGEAFGIIQYRITNRGKDKASIDYKDVYLILNGVRKTFVTEMINDFGRAFGSGLGLQLKGEESRTDNMIFTASENDFNKATLQYGNHAPINIDFKVKEKDNK